MIRPLALVLVFAGCGIGAPPIVGAPPPAGTVAVDELPPPSSTTTPRPITVISEPAGARLAPALRLDPPVAPELEVIETGFGLTPGDCNQYVPLLELYGIEVGWGLRIMARESLCLYNVHNGRRRDDSYGLFQINTFGNLWAGHKGVQHLCGTVEKAELYDPETNIRCAAAMLAEYGRRPWQT